jgi:hypothetical protein
VLTIWTALASRARFPPLPVGEPDPVRRLELIAAETAARKHKARPQAGDRDVPVCRRTQRAWYRHFPQQRSVNLAVTDAPARRCRYTWPVRLAGLIMR